MKVKDWHLIEDPSDIMSPALIFYPQRIKENIRHMVDLAGDAGRLWPHIKTHKCREVIKLQMAEGIDKFKCATLNEALLLGQCSVREAVLAIQPTAIHLEGLFELIERFPKTTFSTLVDNMDSLKQFSKQASDSGLKLHLWLDINNGMNRTGITPGDQALAIYEQMSGSESIEARGFHVYDGHIRDRDVEVRRQKCREAMKPVLEMKEALGSKGIVVDRLIAGGSPSFGVHAREPGFDLSPGTSTLWDAGYGENLPDLPFKPAALLLHRVVSRPNLGIVCTDLGHKSVASEMNFPRIKSLDAVDLEQTGQSEEHLVLTGDDNELPEIGEILYAMPIHICPTVSKYAKAILVDNGRVTGSWNIEARDHEFNLK